VRRTFLAFVLSLIAHPLIIGAVLGISWLTRTELPPRVQQRPVTLRNMSARQWDQNRGARPPEPKPTGQIVDVAPGNRVRPVESKYLAETDNSTKKETRAKEQTNKWRIAAAKPAPPQAVSLASRLEHLEEAEGPKPRPGPLLSSAMATPDDRPVENTETPGGDAPNDDLHDVEKGDGTYLNTREWRFAAFFNRVKQAVSAHWDPNGRLKQREPQRQLLADRVTVLAIALRPDGSIADAFVARPCGIDALDQEAIAAFERAAPFVNPPAALVENGFIRFSFGFTLTHENGGFMPVMSGRHY
jgi:TonB family protein